MLMDSVGPSALCHSAAETRCHQSFAMLRARRLPPRPALPPAREDSALSMGEALEARPAAMLALLDLLDCSCWREANINSASILPDGFAGEDNFLGEERETMNSMRRRSGPGQCHEGEFAFSVANGGIFFSSQRVEAVTVAPGEGFFRCGPCR